MDNTILDILTTGDEAALRDIKVPTPDTIEELNAIIQAVEKREHDYGTCVYAMSISAVAAFNFMARKLGVTGFQASCADLDILKRTRDIGGPFAVIQSHDMLYPQSDIRKKVEGYLTEWQPWATEEAKKLLSEEKTFLADSVKAHWESLAAIPSAANI